MQYAHARVSCALGYFVMKLTRFTLLYRCGGTIGIYYCVKRCSVLYLNSGNGTFTPSPYLDAHGEVDLSMRWAIYMELCILFTNPINTVDAVDASSCTTHDGRSSGRPGFRMESRAWSREN